ncbi:MAG TPA: hypothetical protein VKB93_05090 [Thermoanaerobaculia bacterium]|nr:hypothetical protein [Thermoanaerobaculia bacterium]
MRRLLLVLLLCFSSLSLHALGNGDFAISSLSLDRVEAQTGEPITLTIGVRANGPVASTDININLFNSWGEPLSVLGAIFPDGWQCNQVFPNCFAPTMTAGIEMQIFLQLTTPPVARQDPFTITVQASSGNDGVSDNNRRTVPLKLTPSTRVADLQLDVTAPPNPSPEGSPLTYVFTAKNSGPQELIDVRIGLQVNGQNLGAFTTAGAGWHCNTLLALCARPSLGAGESAPLELKFTAPSFPGEVSVQARLYTTEAHVDPNPSNEEKFLTTFIGDASNWSRVLVPLTETDIPGANGSLWKTELTGLIDSTSVVTIAPEGCGALEDPCQVPPAGTTFDLRRESIIRTDFPAQFIYVRKPEGKKLIVSTRVYDASKSSETAGAFVPTARDEDFSAEGFNVIGVPVAPQFRSTLRVYDATASVDGRVQFALFGDEESVPFHMGVAQLVSDPNRITFTTALLPAHPSIAQLDLSPLIPSRYSRVRVRVAGEDATLRLWGFVSVTNNQTSHVTVITP